MPSCRLCHSDALIDVLDFGPQPISNRFLRDPTAGEPLFPLTLVQCGACGLVQLGQAIPAAQLTPPYPWLSYREPETHLDRLAETLAMLPGLSSESVVWGLSGKDDSLLQRLKRRGFRCTYRLDPAIDLGIIPAGAGVEMVQDRLRPSCVSRLLSGRDRPQLIVARHILEHAHDLREFLAALGGLLSPDGYLAAEVPDCEPALRQLDYTTVWEEHISYFTPATFPQVFAAAGLGLVVTAAYPRPVETLLVGIGQAGRAVPLPPPPSLEGELAQLRAFADGLPRRRRHFAEVLGQEPRGATALLGAGHLACAFLQYLQLQEHVTLVVDDDPRKRGLFMPGSRLPIRGAASLLENGVRLCLLSVHPDAEEHILRRNREFLQRGGRFASIFTASPRALIRPDH